MLHFKEHLQKTRAKLISVITFVHLFLAHPASYLMVTVGTFAEGKAARHEADHSPPSSAEVKNAWSYTSIPNMFS